MRSIPGTHICEGDRVVGLLQPVESILCPQSAVIP
jgi:hypothetical protein